MKVFQYSLFVCTLLTIISSINALDQINVDIIDNVPYIDYTLNFDTNFSIELPDYSELIYSKTLPIDVNYTIKDNILRVNNFDNKKGIIILKYKGTEFLNSIKTNDKALNFELINETQINFTSDSNIYNINKNYILENNTYSWISENKEFILYVQLEKSETNLKLIFIILASIIIIAIIIYPIALKKIKEKKHDTNLFLNDNQKQILHLVKKNALTQQEIANTLNLKKSHMSKILNKMERNNLIERKRVGKVNKIILAEKK